MRWEQLKGDLTAVLAIAAFGLSALSFYVSYLYTNQKLELTVTSVSYNTNQGEVYMTVAFSNAGNRDAALLRVEPALWSKARDKKNTEWVSLDRQIAPNVPLSDPKVPGVVKAGGVEVVRLASKLTPEDAESATVSSEGGAYLGLVVATMNSDGKLYQLQLPVARLAVDKSGRIRGADPAIHRSLGAFANLEATPPGDQLQQNEQTPFVWADQRY